MLFARRVWLTGPVFMILSVILSMLFFLQCVSYYRSTQKYYRLQGYKKTIEDITYTMGETERIANKSSILLAKIHKFLHKKRAHRSSHKNGS